MILIHLNTEAIKTRSPIIEVEDSMTAFIKRLLNTGLGPSDPVRDPTGPQIRQFKNQLSALSVATIRMAMATEATEAGNRARQINTQIVKNLDLWFPKSANQRVLWPTTVELSSDYYETLVKHAVPFDERALAALSNSSMALDIYVWLAQRLCRIHPQADALIPWVSLHQQFGMGYTTRIRKFRQVFLSTLNRVLAAYPNARVRATKEGLVLKQSAPPIQRHPARLSGR